MDITKFLFRTNPPIQPSCHCFFKATWLNNSHVFFYVQVQPRAGHSYLFTEIIWPISQAGLVVEECGSLIGRGHGPVPLRFRQSHTAYGLCRVFNESTCGGKSAHGTDTATLNKRGEELLDLLYIEEYCSEFIFHESSEQSWAWERALSETDAREGRMDGTTIVARLYSVSEGQGRGGVGGYSSPGWWGGKT